MIGEPLVHAGIYQTEEAVYLFLDVHHIMTDGSGMQLLNEDIVRAWKGDRSRRIPTTRICTRGTDAARKKYREDREFFETPMA